jgi:hypothetical protein
MATAIKSFLVLKAKETKAFETKISANANKKATVNFSKQTATTNKILTKAKI